MTGICELLQQHLPEAQARIIADDAAAITRLYIRGMISHADATAAREELATKAQRLIESAKPKDVITVRRVA